MSRFKAQNMWEKMTKEGKSMAEKDATIDKWDYNNRHSKTSHQEKAIRGKMKGKWEVATKNPTSYKHTDPDHFMKMVKGK